jgi:hypothetical protein
VFSEYPPTNETGLSPTGIARDWTAIGVNPLDQSLVVTSVMTSRPIPFLGAP